MKRIYAIILCLLVLIALLMVKIKLLPTVLNNQKEVQQTEKLQKENTLKKKEEKKREAKNIENKKDKKENPQETKQPAIEKKNNKDNKQAKPVVQEKKNSVNNTQSNHVQHVKKETIEPTKPAKKEIVKTKKSYTKEVSVPFETETKYDDTLEHGVQKTVQEGQTGYIVHRITEHYQNNQFISKEEEIIDRKEPIHKKVLIGTKKIERPASNPSSGLERQVFDLINKARTSNGLNALTWNNELAKAANIRAKEIVTNFSHTRPNGEAWHTIAPHMARDENIAYGQTTAQHVHSSWMNSEGHRANILNPGFQTVGIGLYIDNNGTKYWVQLFG